MSQDPALSLGELLRQLRAEANLTQEELAEAAGQQVPGSQRWPRIVMTPTKDALTELAAQRDFLRASERAAARSSRRRRGGVALLALLTALAVAAAGLAFSQRATAIRQRDQAIAGQVADGTSSVHAGLKPAIARRCRQDSHSQDWSRPRSFRYQHGFSTGCPRGPRTPLTPR
jgi:transcriptional regulator with XRE-family HTH domain